MLQSVTFATLKPQWRNKKRKHKKSEHKRGKSEGATRGGEVDEPSGRPTRRVRRGGGLVPKIIRKIAIFSQNRKNFPPRGGVLVSPRPRKSGGPVRVLNSTYFKFFWLPIFRSWILKTFMFYLREIRQIYEFYLQSSTLCALDRCEHHKTITSLTMGPHYNYRMQNFINEFENRV